MQSVRRQLTIWTFCARSGSCRGAWDVLSWFLHPLQASKGYKAGHLLHTKVSIILDPQLGHLLRLLSNFHCARIEDIPPVRRSLVDSTRRIRNENIVDTAVDKAELALSPVLVNKVGTPSLIYMSRNSRRRTDPAKRSCTMLAI